MDPNVTYEAVSRAREEITRKFIIKVYAWMMLALVITGVSGIYAVSSPAFRNFLFGSRFVFIGFIIAEFIVVIYLSSRAFSMSSGAAKFWFVVYAVLNGITLSSIFLVYDLAVIGRAFLVTAALFGVMSAYGYLTKTDLTGVGNLLIMGLFGLIIATVFNMFFRSSGLDLILTYVGVFIFIGLIGYDTQKIKMLSYSSNYEGGISANASIYGALSLYLDFINLFLRLVRLFGRD